jgi:hypothetical protein
MDFSLPERKLSVIERHDSGKCFYDIPHGYQNLFFLCHPFLLLLFSKKAASWKGCRLVLTCSELSGSFHFPKQLSI